MRSCKFYLGAAALLCGLLLASATPVHAGITLFDNFDGGTGYQEGFGWTIGNPNPRDEWVQGEAFTTPGAGPYTLESITIAISLASGDDNVVLTLREDSAGTPGAVIETFNLTTLPAFGTPNAPLTVLSALNPVLAGGTQYWLIAAGGAFNTWAVWNMNSISETGLHAASSGGDPFTIDTQGQGAFRVTAVGGNAVPEPATVVSAGLFGVGLLVFRARRRQIVAA